MFYPQFGFYSSGCSYLQDRVKKDNSFTYEVSLAFSISEFAGVDDIFFHFSGKTALETWLHFLSSCEANHILGDVGHDRRL